MMFFRLSLLDYLRSKTFGRVLVNAYPVDGDTLREGDYKYRLLWMDAPEDGQKLDCGLDAGLSAHCMLKTLCQSSQSLRVREFGFDCYGRILITLRNEKNDDLSLEMIARGYAIPLEGAPSHYWDACDNAISLGLGLWGLGGFEEPKAWRNRLQALTGKPYLDKGSQKKSKGWKPSGVKIVS